MADGVPQHRFHPLPCLAKIDRDALAHLLVETELCPYILARVLDVVGGHAIVPFTISARRDDRFQFVDFEIAALPEAEALIVLQDIRRLRNVRVAGFASPPPAAPHRSRYR